MWILQENKPTMLLDGVGSSDTRGSSCGGGGSRDTHGCSCGGGDEAMLEITGGCPAAPPSHTNTKISSLQQEKYIYKRVHIDGGLLNRSILPLASNILIIYI